MSTAPLNTMTVIVVPDDDDEALCIFAPDIVAGTDEESVIFQGSKVYVRATVWERMRPELESLTTLRMQ